MNNQNFNQGMINQENMTLPPIVTRQTNVVHRYFVINQPHICEMETKVINHYIKRHQYIPKPLCCSENTYCEENLGCCPGMNNDELNNQND